MVKIIPPTIQQMRLFESVARHQSITKAAENVNLTQPSVSMQIKALEEKIGAPLTERVGKTLHLTQVGEIVLSACREILERLDDMEADLEDLQGNVTGQLSVAAVSSAKYFLPQLLGDFKRMYPNVDPKLQFTNRETILARMHENADDFYIMGRPPEENEVIAEPFLENIIVFAASSDHPLIGQKNVSLARIAEESVISREQGSGTRKVVEALFENEGLTLKKHMVFDDSEAIKQGVISGLGVAYLSHHALRLELEAGEIAVLDVQGFPLRRSWYALHRKGKHLHNAAQRFLDHLFSASA